MTPILYAIENGHTELMELFVFYKAEYNFKEKKVLFKCILKC